MRVRPNDLKPGAELCRARDLHLLAHGVSCRAAVRRNTPFTPEVHDCRAPVEVLGRARRPGRLVMTDIEQRGAEQARAASGIGTVPSAADFIDTAPHSTMGNLRRSRLLMCFAKWR